MFVRPGMEINYICNSDICVNHQYCHICTNIYLSVTLILMMGVLYFRSPEELWVG